MTDSALWEYAREERRKKLRATYADNALVSEVAMRLAQTNRIIRSMPSDDEVLDKIPEAVALIQLILGKRARE